jgi:hypothetical protein
MLPDGSDLPGRRQQVDDFLVMEDVWVRRDPAPGRR